MISRRYKADELVGKKCRPIHSIKNGAGMVITRDTVCTIVSAHYGVEIKTEKCPHCGMYASISRIPREDLELLS